MYTHDSPSAPAGAGATAAVAVDVGVDDGLRRDLVAERPGDRGHVRLVGDALDVRRDLGVDGRHDLGAVVVAAEIDLVAVVVGRIVAGRHHDAGIGAEVPHREGEHGRRQQTGEEEGPDAGAGEDLGRVPREDVGVAPPVVADHDGGRGIRLGTLEHEGREPGRGLRDEHAVHAIASGSEPAAKARGAEREAPGEAVVEVGLGGGIPLLRLRDERLELFPRAGVGVLREPGASLLDARRSQRPDHTGEQRRDHRLRLATRLDDLLDG